MFLVGLIGDIDYCCCFVIDEANEAFDLLDERLMRLALLLEVGVDVSVRGNRNSIGLCNYK